MSFNTEDLRVMAENYAKAWSSGVAKDVAAFYAEDGQIVINRGEVLKGRDAIADMADSFYAEFPDLIVLLDELRVAGNHAIFVWTLKGHHSSTKNFVKVGGWEEWQIDEHMKVSSSLGWFDAKEYSRQIEHGQ